MTIITRPILDLESDLFDAVNMAHIASSLIEDALGDDKVHLDLTGRPATYYIPPDSLNAMCSQSTKLRAGFVALEINIWRPCDAPDPPDPPDSCPLSPQV
jgi:hypothetical protein